MTDEQDSSAQSSSVSEAPSVTLTVDHDEGTTELSVVRGSNLRAVLLDAGISPYTAVTERANCGGRGLCATCGVRLSTPRAPDHWHDRLAARFGYPRLSCRLTVERDMHVRIPDKLVWGGRRHDPTRDDTTDGRRE